MSHHLPKPHGSTGKRTNAGTLAEVAETIRRFGPSSNRPIVGTIKYPYPVTTR